MVEHAGMSTIELIAFYRLVEVIQSKLSILKPCALFLSN